MCMHTHGVCIHMCMHTHVYAYTCVVHVIFWTCTHNPAVAMGRDGWKPQGKLCNPDNPDQILEDTAAAKIRHYRNPYRHTDRWLPCRHPCLPRCASTVDSCACSSSRPQAGLANKQADHYVQALGYVSASQARVLSPSQSLLPTTKVHHSTGDGMCSGCCTKLWRSHHRVSSRCCTSRPAAPQHGLRRVRQQ